MSTRILILDEGQEPPSSSCTEFCYKQFRLLVTSDSNRIIEIAKKFNPDLFILDFSMAGHSSRDICRQIQWRQLFGHVPTILTSAYVYDSVDYQTMGCDDIIFKPYSLNELIEKASMLAPRPGVRQFSFLM